MRIVLTGATGFIGRYVIRFLREHATAEIIATANVSPEEAKGILPEGIRYLQADLNEQKENWFSFFQQPDALIHLAWQGLPRYKEPHHLTENLPSQIRLLQNLIEHGLKNITITGTCFEYGMQEGELKEDLVSNPTNAYSIAKDSLRKYLESIVISHGLQLKWLRLFYMYGEGQSANSIIPQLDKAVAEGLKQFNMSGGMQLRDYLTVEEIAERICKTALQTDITGVINCGSGKPVKVLDLVNDHIRKNNYHIDLNLGYYPYSDIEPFEFWGNADKINTILAQYAHHPNA